METIRTKAIEAQALIQACIDGFGPECWAQQGCDLQIAFKDLRGRFRSWCGYVGISQPGNVILQAENGLLYPYIQENDSRQQTILGFIKTLARNLEYCQATLFRDDRFSAGSEDEPETSSDEESDNESKTSDDEESGEKTEAVSRDDQVRARLLGMKHTLNNLYELSYLIHRYKSEENALPKPELLQLNDEGREAEQSRPERRQRITEQGQPTGVISPGHVVDRTERSLRPIRAHIESPHQDLAQEEWEPQADVSQNMPLSRQSSHRDHDVGVAQLLHPSIARNMIQGASPERTLSGPQPQQVPQSGSNPLTRSPNLGRPISRQVPPVDILRSGRLTAAGRDQGDYQRLDQHPQRPPSLQTRSHTNFAPDAPRPTANQVQRRTSSPDGPDTMWSVDPKTKVPVIGQNAYTAPTSLQAEGVVAQRNLVGIADNAERLFPDYIVRPSRFFSLGRVFLVLWAEPSGGNGPNGSNAGTVVTMQEQGTVRNHLGELVFSKVRRFVVIRQSDRYCNALPITTYSGRGVAKRNVVKSEHAIIHTGGAPPQLRPDERPSRGETGMRPVSIRVDPDNQRDRLDPMSRVDFGGVHTVMYNIKTKSLGIVSRGSIDAFLSQFADVWQDQFRTRPRLTEGRSAGGVGGARRISNAPNNGPDDDDDEEEDAADDGTEDEEETSEADTRDK